MDEQDLIVVGAGITGLTAAKEACAAGLAVQVIEAGLFGGLVVNVNVLDGEVAGSGSELASTLMMETMDAGVVHASAVVTSVESSAGGLLLRTDDGGEYRARVVLAASGATLKRLGVPGEVELENRGVSHCADCDGPMYGGKVAVVVGGGDSALQEALVLAEHGVQVHLVHRRDAFTARPHLQAALRAQPAIRVHFDTELAAIKGADGVEGVSLRRRSDGTAADLPCAAVFIYVGLQPAAPWVPGSVARDAAGALVTGPDLQTTLPGLYAAGAVRAGYGGLLAHAIAEGRAAAQSAIAAVRG